MSQLETEVNRTCAVCGSTELTVHTVFLEARDTVVHCMGCGTEFLEPTPSIAELEAYYSGYGTTETSETEFEFLFTQARTYFKQLSGLPINGSGRKPKFLEVGFGHGASLVAAASLGFEAYGVDLDRAAIKSVVERAGKYGTAVKCIHGDINSVSSDLSFDLIKASQVIEHTLQPVQFVQQLYLRQPVGGRLLLECPNNEAAFWYVKNLLRGRYQRMNFYKSLKLSEHLTGFTKKSIQLLLTNAGYEIKQFRDYALRDRTYHHENLLWYPNLSDGVKRTLRQRDSYHFLKSLIPVFDSVASRVYGSGTHMALTAEKRPSSKN